MRRAKLHSGIQVLVVDDNNEHAAGIRGIASLDGGFDVIGTASNADVCLNMIKKFHPDILLMDVNMPDVDGITLLKKIKKIDTNIRVIALTGYDDADLIYRVMKEGARGYVLKTMASALLIQAIIDVSDGKIFLPSVIASKFFDYFQETQDKNEMCLDDENFLDFLTNREEEVLTLLTEGISYKQAAEKLFISETTVKTHVNSIFQKLQVSDKTQAVLYALNHGILNKNRVKRTKIAV